MAWFGLRKVDYITVGRRKGELSVLRLLREVSPLFQNRDRVIGIGFYVDVSFILSMVSLIILLFVVLVV